MRAPPHPGVGHTGAGAPPSYRLAWVSVLAGAAGLCCPVVAPVIAVACGVIAYGAIRNEGEGTSGLALARLGVALGAVLLFFQTLWIVLAVTAGWSDGPGAIMPMR